MRIPSPEYPVFCWWSGGVDSAVACWLAIQIYGKENVRVIFIDTKNEDDDTYRFMEDCEQWYGVFIEVAFNTKYNKITDVWRRFRSLNVATGAICSSVLKREVRNDISSSCKYSFHVFGYDITEPNRARAMTLNYGNINPIYPVLLFGYSKKHNINILKENGIKIPRAYDLGLNNNNCLKTGCVQGGIGYWQLFKKLKPIEFLNMAYEEHFLTDVMGYPITMLKDQSNEAKKKDKKDSLVFLLPHPNYPHIKDISMMSGRTPKPLTDCNGFCNVIPGKKNKTELEINFETK